MSHEQNITTVKEIYDAVARGDVDAILACVTDDVDWAAEAASNAAPWYGQRTGKDGAASFLGDLASSIETSRTTDAPAKQVYTAPEHANLLIATSRSAGRGPDRIQPVGP